MPKVSRLRTADEFRATVRGGLRVARPSMVVHVRRVEGPASRAGLVVGKSLGNAVHRNRTKRQLRHLLAARLHGTPFPVDVVVRALPAADADLGRDLADAWETSLRKLAS